MSTDKVPPLMPKRKPIPDTPEALESAFYDALRRADIDALMDLWADDETIACTHPGAQRLIGYVAIRAAWEEILSRGMLNIKPHFISSYNNMLTAVHHVVEDTGSGKQAQPEIHVIATNVYVKTERGWKMLIHHASVAPGPIPIEPSHHTLLH